MNRRPLNLVPGDPATRLDAATEADAPFIRELFKAGRACDFAAAGLSPGTLETLLEQQFRAQTAGYAMRFPEALHLIIRRHEASIGRLILATGARRWRIVDIQLRGDARGHGIGSDVIAAIVRAGRDCGACDVALSVLSSNSDARRLYLRLGFVETAGDGVHLEMVMPLTA